MVFFERSLAVGTKIGLPPPPLLNPLNSISYVHIYIHMYVCICIYICVDMHSYSSLNRGNKAHPCSPRPPPPPLRECFWTSETKAEGVKE